MRSATQEKHRYNTLYMVQMQSGKERVGKHGKREDGRAEWAIAEVGITHVSAMKHTGECT